MNSKELFGSHDITMVNLWTSTCQGCEDELGQHGADYMNIPATDKMREDLESIELQELVESFES